MDETQPIAEYAPYLEEIRSRIYSLVLSAILAFVAGFFGAGTVISWMIKAFSIKGVTIASSSPFQYVELATSIGMFTALVVIAPLALYHLYSFLRPALEKGERRLFFSMLPLAVLLFALGFAYGIATIYVAFSALASLNSSIGVANIWDIDKFFSQILVTSALLGILFEFPLVLTYLVRIHVLDAQFLRQNRRWAVVAIFVFVALLPPTDGISLLMTALPLVAIYELTIFVNRTATRTA